MEKGIKKFFGSRHFYKHAFAIILPIILQQLFLSIAGYVDSLMINAYGGAGFVEAYNGVSAANRLMFILNFVFIGLAAASSIFIAQYYGAKQEGRILQSFNLSLIVSVLFGVIAFLIIHFFGHLVVDTYLTSEIARSYGYRYLDIMKWGVVIIALNSSISTSFRSVHQPILPMVAGIIGILVNIVFNYLLIFGHFGFPELDSQGAAIATVLSKVVEFVILAVYVVAWKKSYFRKFLKAPKIEKSLFKAFVKRGTPLLMNEILWSTGMVLFALFYTYKNDVWYNAYGYAQNISDLFFIFFAGLGSGTSIILGSSLGAGDFERARSDSYKLKGLAIIAGFAMGLLMIVTAPYIVLLFDPDPITKKMVVDVLTVTAIFITIYAYNSTCFFILRSGGDSVRAFTLDQVPTLCFSLPIIIVLGVNASAWGLTLPLLFLVSHIADILKIFVATAFVKKGKWLFNLTRREDNFRVEAISAENSSKSLD